jgi:hypothetical protein
LQQAPGRDADPCENLQARDEDWIGLALHRWQEFDLPSRHLANRLADAEAHIPHRPPESAFQLRNDVCAQGAIQFVVHRRLQHADVQHAFHEALGARVLGDEFSDDLTPRIQNLLLPEPLFEAECGDHFFQDAPNGPRSVGRKRFFRQTTPLGEHTGAEL